MRSFGSLLVLAAACTEAHEIPAPGDTEDRDFCGPTSNERCSADPGEGETRCYFTAGGGFDEPIARVVHRFESTRLGDAIRVALVLDERFVDNTYGAQSSDGYGRRDDRVHTFRDLVGSDHAEYSLVDQTGATRIRVRIDYISPAEDAPSGWRSRGPFAEEGAILEGSREDVLLATTSLDDNLNVLGCVFTESSPLATQCERWDARVVYTAWFAANAFEPAGFGHPVLDHIHASPSRMANTEDVVLGPCP